MGVGSSPFCISEIYALWGVWASPPPKKKKKGKPFLGKKPESASLNIFKTMSSSQPLLNLSKYKSEDQKINFNLKTGPFRLLTEFFILLSFRFSFKTLILQKNFTFQNRVTI